MQTEAPQVRPKLRPKTGTTWTQTKHRNTCSTKTEKRNAPEGNVRKIATAESLLLLPALYQVCTLRNYKLEITNSKRSCFPSS